MQVKPKQAFTIIAKFLKAKLTALLVGSPGIGKSAIAHQVAAHFNLKVIDFRLAQCDPTDMLGLATIQNGRSAYAPFNTFPIEGDAIPEGYAGWLLFLDEMTTAAAAVQAAAYKVVLDRMVGAHHLHKNVAILCAGNLETDNAIVEPMGTAMQSRLVHLELMVDVKEWVDWASSSNIHPTIISYIEFRPDNLYTFDANHTDKTYACPRTWEFANRILNVTDALDDDRKPMLSGALGEGIAGEFLSYLKIYQGLPKMADIISRPMSIEVPSSPGTLFALTGSISHHATPDNFTSLMTFVNRLPMEFQVVTLKSAMRYKKVTPAHAAAQEWFKNNASVMF